MQTKAEIRRLAAGMALTVVAALTLSPQAAVAQTQGPVPIRISPAQPAEGDTILVEADLLFQPLASTQPVVIVGTQINLPVVAVPVDPAPPNLLLQHFEWTVHPLPAGNYTLVAPSASLGFAVRPKTAQLALVSERFLVTASDQEAGASPAAVTLSDSGGYFSFFDPSNVELTVKLVDGRAVNNHWWVFIASMTNTACIVTILDTLDADCLRTVTCPSRTYTNPASTNQNFIDLAAF